MTRGTASAGDLENPLVMNGDFDEDNAALKKVGVMVFRIIAALY